MKKLVMEPLRWLGRRLSMPVLRRELVEAASKKRTYLVRAAALLVGGFAFASMYEGEVRNRSYWGGVYQVLGSGEEVFTYTFVFAIIGLYAMLPAIIASAVSGEKERDTFVLTLVSGLKPGDIILQKMLGRLIPMASLLMILLPMFAVAFSLGGVTTSLVLTASYTVLLTALQVAAVGMLASSFTATTLGAFLLTYGLLAAIYFVPVLPMLIEELFGIYFLPNWYTDEPVVVMHIPAVAYAFHVLDSGFGGGTSRAVLIWAAISGWAVVVLPLVLARLALVRRAFAKPRGLTLVLFKFLDKVMNRANRVTGGVKLVKERDNFPANNPVAWREVSRRSLGQARYLFRILSLLMIPVIVLGAVLYIARVDRGRQGGEPMTFLIFMILGGAAAILTLMSANTFVTERTHQTFSVLLTTPLTGRQIVKEKLSGPFRMLKVVAIPVIVLLLMECWWEWPLSDVADYNRGRYYTAGPPGMQLAVGLLVLVVIMPQFIWLGAYVGLRSKGTFTALFTALFSAVAWLGVGPLLVTLCWFIADEVLDVQMFSNHVYSAVGYTILVPLYCMTSPAPPLVLSEFADQRMYDDVLFPHYPLMAILLGWHLLLTLGLRWLCLANADRWLGRVPGPEVEDPVMPAAAAVDAAV